MGTTASEAMSMLRPLAFFAGFRDEWLESLYNLATYREHRAGEYVIEEATESNELYIVLSGKLLVEVSLPGEKGKKTVARLAEGELLGELGLVGYDRRSASVRAVSDVTTLYWERASLYALFAVQHQVGYAFMQGLARALAGKLVSTNRDLTSAFYGALYREKDAAAFASELETTGAKRRQG
jgi:CRP/FNR family transcriptional regulator/CRP/FNR family cyclic AMP-dependent transcriptional regulator